MVLLAAVHNSGLNNTLSTIGFAVLAVVVVGYLVVRYARRR